MLDGVCRSGAAARSVKIPWAPSLILKRMEPSAVTSSACDAKAVLIMPRTTLGKRVSCFCCTSGSSTSRNGTKEPSSNLMWSSRSMIACTRSRDTWLRTHHSLSWWSVAPVRASTRKARTTPMAAMMSDSESCECSFMLSSASSMARPIDCAASRAKFWWLLRPRPRRPPCCCIGFVAGCCTTNGSGRLAHAPARTIRLSRPVRKP
mmetsp:Transcript_54673/g.168374  ORF Transcript_54673/g.168374 Transcript_54673/m.168374 type:complete len:206 (-) Transcript_54673:96-713(-)